MRQYNANLYSAISRKRIGGAWRQCLDRLCGSVCRGKELRFHDFLLVHHSNLGPILHRFGYIAGFCAPDPHPYSTLILGGGLFALGQIAHVGVNVSRCLKLFDREIIFEVFQPMWSR